MVKKRLQKHLNSKRNLALLTGLVVVLVGSIFLTIKLLTPKTPVGEFFQTRFSTEIQAKTKTNLRVGLSQTPQNVKLAVGQGRNQVHFVVPFPIHEATPSGFGAQKLSFAGPDNQKLVYSILDNGLREELILSQQATQNTFSTTIELGSNQLKLNPDGIPTFFNHKGEYLFEFGQPFARDAAGNTTTKVSFSVTTDPDSHKTKLIKTIDPDWLFSAERAYPITIDPTVITIANSKTPTISRNYLHDNVQLADTTPIIKFGAIDPQADALVYEVSWDTTSAFSAPTTVASDANAGFANETTPADTSPFNSGDVVTYTFQSALSNNTTYFYRLRAKDPGGDNTYSSYSETRSFTINTGTVDSTWFQTRADQFNTNFKTASITVNAGTNDVEAADTTTNTRYYRPITITNPGTTLTNHHVLVEIDTASLVSGGKLLSDCSDLRVSTDNDGQSTLTFWIEQGCNTATTQVWVEVPSVPTGDSIIYFIYDYVTGITDSEVNWAGNFIFPSNASCGAGYTTDASLNARFLRGSSTYGGTGGATTHTHSFSGVTGYAGGGVNSQTGGSDAGGHYHNIGGTTGSGTSIPSYLDFIFCSHPSPLPLLATQYFGYYSSVALGWTQLNGNDNRFPRGNSTYGATGGGSSHTHSYSDSVGNGQDWVTSSSSNGGAGTDTSSGHSHTVSGTTDSDNSIPPYYELAFATPTSSNTKLPVGVILTFDTAPPLGWTRFSNLDSKILRIGSPGEADSVANSTHGHAGSGTSGFASGTHNYDPGVVRDFIGNHQHGYSITTGPPSTGTPPYMNMLFYSRNNDNVTTSVGTEVLSTGFIRSTAITADYLGDTQAQWDTFSFTDDETFGDLKYRFYFDDNGSIEILPDSALAGNSTGFDTSPVDISGVSATTYPTLYVTGTFEYSGGSAKLQDWTVTVNNAPNTPTLDAPTNAATNQSLFTVLRTTATDQNSDAIRYKIEICTNVGMTTGCQTFDQSTSQTGWSGQNALTSTAYTSGTQGVYTVQTALTANTTYYWRSYAIDPNGSNIEGDTQTTPYSFTTSQSPNIPTLDSPTDGATNQSLTPVLRTTTTDGDSDPIRYRIYLCTESNMIGCQIFDQNVSQTGWSGQNALTSTAYTSGTQGVYTVQTSLLPNKTYYWKSQAIDPTGSNNFGLTQTNPFSFSTVPQPNAPSGCVLRETTNDSSLTLTWSDDDSSEDGFQIEKATNGGGFSLLTSPAANTTSYQDTAVAQGNTYQYRVRAHFTVSSTTSYSNWCTTSTLSLQSGLFNFQGLNLEGVNLN